MEILVDRKYKKNTYTIGIMYINGKYFSETMEDKDRGLMSGMSETEIKSRKIYGMTAIPTGRYKVKLTYSPKFKDRPWAESQKGKVIQIMNVKGFSAIRIHPGNTAEDSLGCILVGRNLERGKVVQSAETYQMLATNYVAPALERGEEVWITIK